MRRLHIYLVSVLIIFVLARFSVYADEGLRQNQASFKWIRPVQGQILKPYSKLSAAGQIRHDIQIQRRKDTRKVRTGAAHVPQHIRDSRSRTS